MKAIDRVDLPHELAIVREEEAAGRVHEEDQEEVVGWVLRCPDGSQGKCTRCVEKHDRDGS